MIQCFSVVNIPTKLNCQACENLESCIALYVLTGGVRIIPMYNNTHVGIRSVVIIITSLHNYVKKVCHGTPTAGMCSSPCLRILYSSPCFV